MISRMREIEGDFSEIVRVQYPGFSVPFSIYSEDELLSSIIRRQGWYSHSDLRVYDLFLSEGDTVVDAGANIGWYAIYAATLVGERGTVIAIEPDPHHCALLAKNAHLASLSQVVIMQAALGKENGAGELRRSPNNFGDHHMAPLGEKLLSGSSSVPVRVVTLDSVLEGIAKVPRLIKLDLQGSEPDALAGMKNILLETSTPLLLVEFSPGLILRAGGSPFELFAFIEKNRFVPFRVAGDHVSGPLLKSVSVEELVSFTQEARSTELGWDLLLVRADTRADLSLCLSAL